MSRTSILAAAAIAALGISAFAMTDASAAARGGAKVARGGGGSVSRVAVHPGSHGGGLHRGGTHRSTIARISHPGRTGIGRRLPPGIMIARNPPGTPPPGNQPPGNNPPPLLPPPVNTPPWNPPPLLPPPVTENPPVHIGHWCRHHHHVDYIHHWRHWCGHWGIALEADAAPVTYAANVCTNDCDYFLNDGSTCYMAKRRFSTPQGDELRCVKICDDATDVK